MGENQIMEKKLSLQKLIAEIILVAYSLVLLMLVFLEVYMFANYRNTIREKWQNILWSAGVWVLRSCRRTSIREKAAFL